MRKIGGILLSVLLAVALTGACGDDDEDTDSSTANTSTTISSAQTSTPPLGVTSTSIRGGVTTLQGS